MSALSSRQAGVSLVEVMIALALGLIVSVGALSLMLGNRQANRTTESLSRVQEGSRVAFELMSRDLRSAGINACNGGVSRVMNLLRDPGTRWWSEWTGGLRGFAGTDASGAVLIGTAEGQRVSGTDLMEVMHGSSTAFPVKAHNTGSADATLSGLTVPAYSIAMERPGGQSHSFVTGDLVVACDYVDSAIFQITGVNADAHSIAHAAASGEPGNCSASLGFRLNCATSSVKTLPPGALVMRLEPVAWYVGYNGRTGSESSPTSLYRISVRGDGAGNAVATREEVIEGVTAMTVAYMFDEDYRSVAQVSDWSRVTGVEITLTIQSPESGTTTGSSMTRLQRTVSHVVNLRNRVK